MLWMCLIALNIVAAFLFFRVSAVPNLILCEMLMKNGILLTNIISPDISTSPYNSLMSFGRSISANLILCGVVRTVFPFSDPRFGPNICSAFSKTLIETGMFGRRLFLMIIMYARRDGLPILSCIVLASSADFTSRFVNLVLLSSTVVRKMFEFSFFALVPR